MAKAKNSFIVTGDTKLDDDAAARMGVSVLAILRDMLNPDGSFKNPEIQLKFEKFCQANGY